MLFPFKYSIDPKDHKSEEEKMEEYSENLNKAIAVEGVGRTKALTKCNGLAGSALQDGGDHLNIETLQLLVFAMPV